MLLPYQPMSPQNAPETTLMSLISNSDWVTGCCDCL